MDTRAKTARKKIGNAFPKVYQHFLEGSYSPRRVLDYGCGYGQAREAIEAKGHLWFGTDLVQRVAEENFIPANELYTTKHRGTFKLILLSNVLNVQENEYQLTHLLDTLNWVAETNATLIANYPDKPRKMPGLTFQELQQMLRHRCWKLNVVWV